jgi:hypothetical protein
MRVNSPRAPRSERRVDADQGDNEYTVSHFAPHRIMTSHNAELLVHWEFSHGDSPTWELERIYRSMRLMLSWTTGPQFSARVLRSGPTNVHS